MQKIPRWTVLRPVLSLMSRVPVLADRVIEDVADALSSSEEDGRQISAEEAEDIALGALEGAGADVLRVRVRGKDIADERVEELLARLIGRVTYNVRNAVRDSP